MLFPFLAVSSVAPPKTTGPNTPLTTDSATTASQDVEVVSQAGTGSPPGSRVITIAAVVTAASVFLVVLSVLIFLVIFYLRMKTKNMVNYDFNSSTSSESPPSQKKSESAIIRHRTQNGNSNRNFSTLPSKLEERKEEEFLDEECRYQSLPVLAAAQDGGVGHAQQPSFQWIDLSELGSKV